MKFLSTVKIYFCKNIVNSPIKLCEQQFVTEKHVHVLLFYESRNDNLR